MGENTLKHQHISVQILNGKYSFCGINVEQMRLLETTIQRLFLLYLLETNSKFYVRPQHCIKLNVCKSVMKDIGILKKRGMMGGEGGREEKGSDRRN